MVSFDAAMECDREPDVRVLEQAMLRMRSSAAERRQQLEVRGRN
jgi:hypothetical protein